MDHERHGAVVHVIPSVTLAVLCICLLLHQLPRLSWMPEEHVDKWRTEVRMQASSTIKTLGLVVACHRFGMPRNTAMMSIQFIEMNMCKLSDKVLKVPDDA